MEPAHVYPTHLGLIILNLPNIQLSNFLCGSLDYTRQ